MAADFTIIQGTSQPPLVATLCDQTGTAIDLTQAASVALLLKNRQSNAPVATAPVTVLVPATSGQVGYVWRAADTATAGIYDARFLVTWTDGTTQAVPSTEEAIEIVIVGQIGAGQARLTAPAIRGYCQPEDVADFLGVTFTGAQLPHVLATIGRVERWIDEELNRTWLSGPIQAEAKFSPYGLDPPSFFTSYVAGWVPLGSAIYLNVTPVQSVERMQGVGWLNSDPFVLVRNLDYEVRDLPTGLIRLTVPSAYYKVMIDYSPVNACPGDITQLAVMVAATWLIPNLNPDSWLVDSVQLPDLKIVYAKASNSVNVPPECDEIIERYRFRSIA